MTRFFLLGSVPDTEFYGGECKTGVVAIDDTLLDLIRKRRAGFSLARGADEKLDAMMYWDARVHFFDADALDAELLLTGLTDPEISLYFFDDNQFVEIDEALYDHIVKEFEETDTELDTMIIRAEGISWTASPEDCDLSVTTTVLPYDVLFAEKKHDPDGSGARKAVGG